MASCSVLFSFSLSVQFLFSIVCRLKSRSVAILHKKQDVRFGSITGVITRFWSPKRPRFQTISYPTSMVPSSIVGIIERGAKSTSSWEGPNVCCYEITSMLVKLYGFSWYWWTHDCHHFIKKNVVSPCYIVLSMMVLSRTLALCQVVNHLRGNRLERAHMSVCCSIEGR